MSVVLNVCGSDPWIPLTNGQYCVKPFYIMTSSRPVLTLCAECALGLCVEGPTGLDSPALSSVSNGLDIVEPEGKQDQYI